MEIGTKLRSKLRKAANIYGGLHCIGEFAPVPAFVHTMQAVFFSVFRKEEYGVMMSYDFIYFKHPEIYPTLFTRKDNAALLPAVNDQAQLFLLRQKHLLSGRLGDVGRRFLFVPGCSMEEVRDFLKREGGYVLKPDEGAASVGISFLYSDGETLYLWNPVKETRQKCGEFLPLYQEWQSGNVLIEEYIWQHSRLNTLFSGCVSTIYLHTVLLPDGHAEIANAPFVTFGCGASTTVNAGDQVTVGIQPDGSLASYGFHQKRDRYGFIQIEKTDRHPDTGVMFHGISIPYWEEAKRLAVISAEKFPELVYIKWDIAITDAGPVIIEGNGAPGTYSFWQMSSLAERKKGVRAELSELYRAITFSKSLTPEKIETVNQTVADFPSGCPAQDCGAVIVLGSTRCTSRIAAAFEAFGHDDRVQYILCGGCASEHPKNPLHPEEGNLTEADYMRRYLMERGIPSERIFTDNASYNTAENLAHAAKLLHPLGVRKAAIVSAWFHGRRVSCLVSQLNHLGLSADSLCFVPAYGEQTHPDRWTRTFYGIKAIYHEVQSVIYDS